MQSAASRVPFARIVEIAEEPEAVPHALRHRPAAAG